MAFETLSFRQQRAVMCEKRKTNEASPTTAPDDCLVNVSRHKHREEERRHGPDVQGS